MALSRQKVGGLGFSLTAKAVCLCVEFYGEGAAVGQEGLGLVEQEQAVVPVACGFLDAVEALCKAGGDFGGLAADLGDVPGGFAGFADGVEVVVVFRVEAAQGGDE